MKPCLLIQNNVHVELYAQVTKCARNLNIEVIDRSITPEFDIFNCGVNWDEYGPVIVYGSVDFINEVAKHPRLAKYIYNSRQAFAMSNLVEQTGRNMFNYPGTACTTDLVTRWLSLWEKDQSYAGLFIRPDSAHKSFNGGVYNARSWGDLIREKKLSSDLMCWVSDKKAVPRKEYRCWVIDGKITGVSQYMEDGVLSVKTISLSEPNEFFKYATPLISVLKSELGQTLPPNYVIDFALSKGVGWASFTVMELNCINSSGFYGLDSVPNILAAWMEYLIKES